MICNSKCFQRVTSGGKVRNRRRIYALVVCAAVLAAWCGDAHAAAPPGRPVEPTEAEKAAMAELGKRLKAKIAWSSSRLSGKHDIFIMNADGSDKKPLTKSDAVDWFPQFSPDGRQVLFARSKKPWMSEAYAYRNKQWDIYVINVDGTGEKKLVDDACWGTWINGGSEVLYSRNTGVYSMELEGGKEKLVLDSAGSLRGSQLQQPQMSPDGRNMAVTLRGRLRETGIWNFERKEWTKVGGGCQINWFPSGDRIYWMHPTGMGDSEVLSTAVKDGKPADPGAKYTDLKWVDLPGRRSHEYFPKVSSDGRWLVWCATIYGHDHDIYDYEVHCWRIGEGLDKAVRLTFHEGNDRWPDIYVMPEAKEAEKKAETGTEEENK
ncbi:MAG: PD40 domain-containing protein [Planctomycetes bacterium]|nr:PD40 domain-containing protein [Planctomycetota bacterium]